MKMGDNGAMSGNVDKNIPDDTPHAANFRGKIGGDKQLLVKV